jgi:UDP-N-acetylmuramate: L-alanyl-gamma-D-glutamyl-meso-diaminopimelate ligase
MRLGTMKERLAASLEIADRVYVFAADLGWDAEAVLRPLGPRARSFSDLGGLVAAVVADARPGDHVLVMSNGSFGGVHGKLLQAIEGKAKA